MHAPSAEYVLLVATPEERRQMAICAAERGLGGFRERKRGPELHFRKQAGLEALGGLAWLGEVGGSRVVVARTTLGPLTFRGSAAKAITLFTGLQAQHVISVGMAFGTDPTTQKIGQVLVATSMLPYDLRIAFPFGAHCPKCQGIGTSPRRRFVGLMTQLRRFSPEALVQEFRRSSYCFCQTPLLRASEALLANFEETVRNSPGWSDRVIFGPLLTGAARVSSTAYRDELVRGLTDRGGVPVGGEMEGAGLASVCHPDRPAWGVIKGISDFANDGRDAALRDEHRAQACYAAVDFVLDSIAAEWRNEQ